MSNTTEVYKDIQEILKKLEACYEGLFELRLKKKTANSEEQKKDLLKSFKEKARFKKDIKDLKISKAKIIKEKDKK